MGRAPCCDEVGLKKGPWTPEEDQKLIDYIQNNGHGSWRNLPKCAGLNRCGKSCRLRWTNYLRPDIKRGEFSEEEERLIIHLHSVLGNKWSAIATRLSGRTDNEIKNYWNTHVRKKLLLMGIDPVTHRQRTELDILSDLPSLLATANFRSLVGPWNNSLRLQADAAQLARLQVLQGLVQVMTSEPSPAMDPMSLLGPASSLGYYGQFNDIFQMSRQVEAIVNGSLRLTQDAMIPTTSDLSKMGIQQLSNHFRAYCEPSNPTGEVSQIKSSFSNDLIAGCNDRAAKQIVNSYTFPMVDSTPPLVSSSPENHITTYPKKEPVSSNDVSANSSPSNPFEAWEGLCDLDNDLCWKDILEHVSSDDRP